ncbi:MAG TPA: transglycosylase domain-containing protein [Ktedonobacteraceae bacterium]|nr:transglycosylase domain-containing protein [Ktedonobacteraceae bacterium]
MNSNFLPPGNEPQPYQGRPGYNPAGPGNGPASQPPAFPPYQAPPVGNGPGALRPQGQMPPQSPQQRYGASFLARPVQAMRRWSQKMTALRRPEQPPVDQNPLVRYYAPQPGTLRSQPQREEPWRRSRAQKVTRIMRKRRERSGETGPGRLRLVRLVSSVIAALLLLALGIGSYSAYAYYQDQLPQMQKLANLQTEQSTRFYDRNGKLIYTLYDTHIGRSIPVTYSQIPGYLQDAQIAAEDKTFWQNEGVDLQAILRSAFIDANAGAAQTGASTLTQQVIKNLLTAENNGKQPDRTPQEKIAEATLAIGLTQQYSKAKIIEMYFNISAYGAQEQGVEAAAQDYFGLQPKCDSQFHCTPAIDFLDRDNSSGKCKNANDDSTCPINPLLGLARATLLTSIPQNPVIYDPTVHPEYYSSLLDRQDYTLKQMQAAQMGINLGTGSQKNYATADGKPIFITNDVIKQVEALSKDMKFVGFEGYNAAPHFVQWVIQNLANALGNYQDIDPDSGISIPGYRILLTSGLNVQTTLDLNLETYVENAVKRHITQPEYQPFLGVTTALSKSDNLHDSAVVVMDAKTGEVLAMDGSVNYNDTSKAGAGKINMAVRPRQPGSSFKPIVIAAAYQMGWYPGIVLPDIKTYFPVGNSQSQPANDKTTYAPTDYGDTYHNLNSNIELAISNSFNIPALKAQYFAGLQNVYTMATRLGITSITPVRGVAGGLVNSLALGTDPVSLLEMVGAYQTFANQGVHVPAQGVLNIWDNYGHQLYHYDPSKVGARVLSKQVSYLITSTLSNESARALEFEGDHVLSMWDWTLADGTHPDVAAKTGTTDSFKDNWTIGYTPDVVVGVWSGNADNTRMVNSIGVTGAAPIWHSVIEYVSGKCNTSTDQISCPKLDLHYTTRHFSVPDGVIQQQVNTYNGLAGAGYLSYMIDGEQPGQSGAFSTCQGYNCNGNGDGNGNGHGNN